MGAIGVRCEVRARTEGAFLGVVHAGGAFDVAVGAFVVSGVVRCGTEATDCWCLTSLSGMAESEAVSALVAGASSVVLAAFAIYSIYCQTVSDHPVCVVFC